ncbi:MAG: nitroreductase family deazaflavin-dependent oxidoreductase [Actinobacteria bacterium]|nr:nitroreductase family deazaflavin-dependent oxidoreductase [Actinomycetota bacterium]
MDDVADDDYCYLTTTGRVSGRPHEIEIWFALEGSHLFLLGGGRDSSDWVRNLLADPQVTVRLRDRIHSGRARTLDEPSAEPELDRHARTLLFEKYEPRSPGLASWRESALPVVVELDRSA